MTPGSTYVIDRRKIYKNIYNFRHKCYYIFEIGRMGGNYESKTRAILAYIFGWLGGLIVLFAVKDNEKIQKYMQHKQS